MLWIFLLAIVLVVVAFVILLTGKRSNPYLFRHVSAFARSAGANIVPAGYCVAMAFFLTLFDTKFLVHTNYSIAHKSFIKLCYFLPFISFAILYFSDPGQINKQNHRELTSMFPYDRILYSPFVECRTCLFTKPARSKHCSVCKSCVAFHDHHCIWVNNCVGLWNFRWFMLFLVVNMYVFAYGFFLLLIPLIPSIKTVLTHKWRAFGYLINLGEFERTGACLLLLCTFLFPLVLAFSYFHLHYLWAGVTTNEADKWEDIYVLISLQVLYIYEGTNTVLMKKKDGNFNRKPTHAEEQHIKALNSQLKLVESVAELPNIYDLGTKANIMQRIFPKSSTNKIDYVV